MADRGLRVIDRVVTEEMGGKVNQEKNAWVIPETGKGVETAMFD